MSSNTTKRRKAWDKFISATLHPPKRYNHLRNKTHEKVVHKLKEQL